MGFHLGGGGVGGVLGKSIIQKSGAIPSSFLGKKNIA